MGGEKHPIQKPLKGVFRKLWENVHGLSLREVTDVGREYEAVEKFEHLQRGLSIPLALAPKDERRIFRLLCSAVSRDSRVSGVFVLQCVRVSIKDCFESLFQ